MDDFNICPEEINMMNFLNMYYLNNIAKQRPVSKTQSD